MARSNDKEASQIPTKEAQEPKTTNPSTKVTRSRSTSAPTYSSTSSTASRQSPVIALVLVAASYGSFLAWQWWKTKKRPSGSKAKKASARSIFSFGKPKAQPGSNAGGGGSKFFFGKPKTSSASREAPTSMQAKLQAKFAGNPKKDKNLRRSRNAERKANKEAKKDAAKAHGGEIERIIASKAEKQGLGKGEERTVTTYLDLEKT
eukprot:gene15571-21669_t